MVGGDARQAYAIEANGHQIGEAAGLDPARLGPADARSGARRRRAEQRYGAMPAALAALEPLVELDRARFFEHVDQGVAVRAQGETSVGFSQATCRRDAVGEVALRRRTETRSASRRAEQGEVGVDQMRGVDCGEALGEGIGPGEQL